MGDGRVVLDAVVTILGLVVKKVWTRDLRWQARRQMSRSLNRQI